MIGLFDSGVGGLFALRQVRRLLPRADICYLADTRNLPYGMRPGWEVLALSRHALGTLLQYGARAILFACGTASSLALPRLMREYGMPLAGLLDPLGRADMRGKRVALLATRATVESGRMAACLSDAAAVFPLACPTFVGMAERGKWDAREIRRALSPLAGRAVDTVVLGCTHFSALLSPIAAAFPGAAIFDAAKEAATAFVAALPPALREGTGETHLYTTGDRPSFLAAADRILAGE